MTPGETIAAVLPFVCLVAALFRARIVALALAPSCIGIIAGIGFGVDTSSASHPIRWIVPIATLVLAGFATWWYAHTRFYDVVVGKLHWESGSSIAPNIRALVASLLILASTAPDLLALHPLFWAHTREWPLVPLQIALCGTILALLLAPERMIAKVNRSLFATVAMLMAVGAGFTMAPPPPAVERMSPPKPIGPAPWLAPTLPPYEPPRREPKPKRRSKAERLQRRKKRKQRGK